MTTRRYSRDIDRDSRTRVLAAATIVAILVLATDHLSGGFFRAQLWKLEAGWQRASQGASAGLGFFGIAGSESELARENETLRAQVAQYQTLALSAIALKEENATLSNLVHLSQARPGVTAPVISSETTTGIFLLGAGTREGVAIGDIVRGEDGYALGRVVDVSATTATCATVFAPGGDLEALIGDTALHLTGRGAGNGEGKAPRDAEILLGDVVTAPAYRGHPVATVGHVEIDAAGAYKGVLVRATRSIGSLRYVFIERP